MDDLIDFPGFGPAAFDWLDQLAADNSRAFFAASRATFDAELRDPFAAMLGLCASETGGRPRVFRQLRDLRFAANQERPYWPTIAGEITRPETAAALIADLSPDGLTALAGYRRPFTRDQLTRYRAAVDDATSGAELEEIAGTLRNERLAVHGATLRRAPRGFPAGHARAELLRHTALFAGATLAPKVRRRRGRADRRAISADAALSHLAATWDRLVPLTDWLDTHVGPVEMPAAEPGAVRAA
ncbi:MAG: DUF2461 family protein [Baekduiaceae bacterium]